MYIYKFHQDLLSLFPITKHKLQINKICIYSLYKFQLINTNYKLTNFDYINYPYYFHILEVFATALKYIRLGFIT